MNTQSMQFIEQEHIPEGRPKVYVIANSAEDALASQEKIERKGGIRLTNQMRQSIVDKIYEFKFKKPGEALDKLELRLSHKAMVAKFGKSTLDALAKIGAPYAFVAADDYGEKFSGEALENWKGKRVMWRVGALGYQYHLYTKDPLPLHPHHFNSHFVVKPGPLADEIVAWQEATQEWLKEKNVMGNKVNAVLNSVTTYASLQRTWPDGERFWKHLPIDFPFRNQVPAVKIDDLNEALGI